MKKPFSKPVWTGKLMPRIGKISSVPGTIKYVGVKREAEVKLHVLDYNEKNFTEKELTNVDESLPFKESPTVTWLNVSGVHDEVVINEVGDRFKIHPLALEDIANTL